MEHDVERFRRACLAAGCHIPRCGLAVRDLVHELKRKPVKLELASGTLRSIRAPEHARMGVAISNGLACFDRERKLYVITEKGKAWLKALKAHGLAGQEVAA